VCWRLAQFNDIQLMLCTVVPELSPRFSTDLRACWVTPYWPINGVQKKRYFEFFLKSIQICIVSVLAHSLLAYYLAHVEIVLRKSRLTLIRTKSLSLSWKTKTLKTVSTKAVTPLKAWRRDYCAQRCACQEQYRESLGRMD
jgi:hypothetical protein